MFIMFGGRTGSRRTLCKFMFTATSGPLVGMRASFNLLNV